MSKKKSVEISTELDFAKDLFKRYGDVISLGSRVFERKRNLKTLTVSPAFDLSLNGGLVEGSTTIISGPPKCGKTTTVMQVCANGQKEGRDILYVDGESRLKDYNLVGVTGLDLSKMKIIHSPEDSDPLSAEDFLNILEFSIKLPEHTGAIAVIDSTSSLIPRAELDSEASGQLRANLPKLLTHWLKKNAQTIVKQKIILILIAHYITNTSGWGKKFNTDSGLYMQYQGDTIIDYNSVKAWEESGTKIGQSVEWDILCSSKGSSGKRCTSHIRYGTGIDKVKEIIVLGNELGLIDKAGSWYSNPFLEELVEDYKMEDYRFQGEAKLYDFFKTNPDRFKQLEDKVREVLS